MDALFIEALKSYRHYTTNCEVENLVCIDIHKLHCQKHETLCNFKIVCR